MVCVGTAFLQYSRRPSWSCDARRWLDGSWVYSINQAAAQRMTFGHDIIFTYGPYASVYTQTYHPATVWMMLLGYILFYLCYACCFAWLVRPAAWSWTLMLAAMLFAPLIQADVAAYSYMLLEVLFVFRLLDEETGESSKPLRLLLAASIFGCAGMLPLVKCSFGVIQLGVSALCLAFLILHRRWMMALVCVFATPIAMLLFWIAAGQRVADLLGYFSSSIPVISGYSQAMSALGQRRETALFLAGALAILLAIVRARSLRRSLKLFLLLAYALYLLVSFKEGFVRQDEHVYVALVALALASLFLMLLQTPRRKRFSPVFCSIALVAMITAIGFFWRINFDAAVQDEGIPPETFRGLNGWALLNRFAHRTGQWGTSEAGGRDWAADVVTLSLEVQPQAVARSLRRCPARDQRHLAIGLRSEGNSGCLLLRTVCALVRAVMIGPTPHFSKLFGLHARADSAQRATSARNRSAGPHCFSA